MPKKEKIPSKIEQKKPKKSKGKFKDLLSGLVRFSLKSEKPLEDDSIVKEIIEPQKTVKQKHEKEKDTRKRNMGSDTSYTESSRTSTNSSQDGSPSKDYFLSIIETLEGKKSKQVDDREKKRPAKAVTPTLDSESETSEKLNKFSPLNSSFGTISCMSTGENSASDRSENDLTGDESRNEKYRNTKNKTGKKAAKKDRLKHENISAKNIKVKNSETQNQLPEPLEEECFPLQDSGIVSCPSRQKDPVISKLPLEKIPLQDRAKDRKSVLDETARWSKTKLTPKELDNALQSVSALPLEAITDLSYLPFTDSEPNLSARSTASEGKESGDIKDDTDPTGDDYTDATDGSFIFAEGSSIEKKKPGMEDNRSCCRPKKVPSSRSVVLTPRSESPAHSGFYKAGDKLKPKATQQRYPNKALFRHSDTKQDELPLSSKKTRRGKDKPLQENSGLQNVRFQLPKSTSNTDRKREAMRSQTSSRLIVLPAGEGSSSQIQRGFHKPNEKLQQKKPRPKHFFQEPDAAPNSSDEESEGHDNHIGS